MSALFEGTDFNGDVSNWDVSNVINMRYTFSKCKSFNQDISKWDVSNVIDTFSMFSGEYIVIALAKISKISYVAPILVVNIMELR